MPAESAACERSAPTKTESLLPVLSAVDDGGGVTSIVSTPRGGGGLARLWGLPGGFGGGCGRGGVGVVGPGGGGCCAGAEKVAAKEAEAFACLTESPVRVVIRQRRNDASDESTQQRQVHAIRHHPIVAETGMSLVCHQILVHPVNPCPVSRHTRHL